ncbi:type II secretion system protein [Lentisphaera profundi]|uniref:Type II secretion system protein n=1 Tax=Lentisphaera profundi TaxID=1658616 RepID=A0ABY7W3M4_9BACT|nr:type II secretion system protein [Lentisphaera profundi]WDE98863.1 type II secretion system protein [Lentisphaera profundi]
MKKFSLIELLVVIAIIGILASFILPSLGKSREKAQVTICKNNQKQIGLAIYMYMDSNNGKFPLPGQITDISWDGALGAYDGRNLSSDEMKSGNQWTGFAAASGLNSNIYTCPLDTRTTVPDGYLRSYGPTDGSGSGTHNSLQGVAGFSADPGPDGEASWYYGFTRNISEINNLSTAGFIAETYNPGINPHLRFAQGGSYHNSRVNAAWFQNNEAIHKDLKFNFLLGDGHVEPLTFVQSMITTDGSVAATNDVRGTIWDVTK